MRRYYFWVPPYSGTPIAEEDAMGKWVLYAEAEEEIARRDREIGRLQKRIEALCQIEEESDV